MAEFKYIQWGKGVPVEYQRLNAMMNNDQYLKDLADPAPRGILAWKRQGVFTQTSATGTFTGMSNVPFYVEANRLITFEWHPGMMVLPLNSAAWFMEVSFSISDAGGTITQTGGSYATNNSYAASAPSIVIPNVALSVGAHTVSVTYLMGTGPTLYVGYNGYSQLIVRDEGEFVASL